MKINLIPNSRPLFRRFPVEKKLQQVSPLNLPPFSHWYLYCSPPRGYTNEWGALLLKPDVRLKKVGLRISANLFEKSVAVTTLRVHEVFQTSHGSASYNL